MSFEISQTKKRIFPQHKSFEIFSKNQVRFRCLFYFFNGSLELHKFKMFVNRDTKLTFHTAWWQWHTHDCLWHFQNSIPVSGTIHIESAAKKQIVYCLCIHIHIAFVVLFFLISYYVWNKQAANTKACCSHLHIVVRRKWKRNNTKEETKVFYRSIFDYL